MREVLKKASFFCCPNVKKQEFFENFMGISREICGKMSGGNLAGDSVSFHL